MIIREARLEDIPQIQLVRNSVKENMLSDPAFVPDEAVSDYITRHGKGWVCETNNEIVGFSIISVMNKNVWALFIDPRFEKNGIGRQLHDIMMDWYFDQTNETAWLGTDPGTRAEIFYRNAKWIATGLHGKREIRFEMSFDQWKSRI